MKKNFKRLSAAAFASVIGLGLAGSPIMAANPSGETDVFYTTEATSVDKDGKVVMIVPAAVSLNKATPKRNFAVTMKTSDPNKFLPDNFEATVDITSGNNGMLKNDTFGSYKYDLKTGGEENADGNTIVEFVDAQGQPAVKNNKINFAANEDGNLYDERELSQWLTADASANITNFELADPGTIFEDKLTFTVSALSGTGLKPQP